MIRKAIGIFLLTALPLLAGCVNEPRRYPQNHVGNERWNVPSLYWEQDQGDGMDHHSQELKAEAARTPPPPQ